MPPVGNFAVPASTSKENKKRPRNATSTPSGPQPNTVGESSARNMVPVGKVRTNETSSSRSPVTPCLSISERAYNFKEFRFILTSFGAVTLMT
jgi:paired amphipathic helix protein Sin3a